MEFLAIRKQREGQAKLLQTVRVSAKPKSLDGHWRTSEIASRESANSSCSNPDKSYPVIRLVLTSRLDDFNWCRLALNLPK